MTFYFLNEDSNGFRPLYLGIKTEEDTIIAWSCPPENYPKPIYTIRSMQIDILPKSILTEIKITKKTNQTIYFKNYKIKLTKQWIKDNYELWKGLVH
tara:strand:- start:162 stop:452 length:291 start_codon:yes stop_codon:yes gene_type:complete